MTDPQPPDILPDGRRIPTLFAVASESGQSLIIFCIYCGKHHWHGRNPDDPIGASDGHHVAHCIADDSPYRDTGYLLVEVEGPLPEPAWKIKTQYAKDGTIVSGFLMRQKRDRERLR